MTEFQLAFEKPSTSSVVFYCEASFKTSFFDLKASAFKITKWTRNIQIEESLNETVSDGDIFKEEAN